MTNKNLKVLKRKVEHGFNTVDSLVNALEAARSNAQDVWSDIMIELASAAGKRDEKINEAKAEYELYSKECTLLIKQCKQTEEQVNKLLKE